MSDATVGGEVINPAELKRVKDAAVAANIKILENFFSFVIGFALTQATMNLVDTWTQAEVTKLPVGATVLYAALLVTIVPFYQGMSRFLYETHVVRPLQKPGARSSPMLLDIWAFMAMSCIIFAMGRFLNDPIWFFYLWSLLLVTDIAWTLTVWWIQKSRVPKWALNNAIWLILAWGYWWAIHRTGFPTTIKPGLLPALAYGFVLFEALRSVFDYWINWKFYFPPEYRGAE